MRGRLCSAAVGAGVGVGAAGVEAVVGCVAGAVVHGQGHPEHCCEVESVQVLPAAG